MTDGWLWIHDVEWDRWFHPTITHLALMGRQLPVQPLRRT